MNRVAIAVLAAGGSSRMGRPKQLLPFRGRSLLMHATDVALEARCGPVFVVLGAYVLQLRPVFDALPVEVIVNEEWERGPGTSVRVAVKAVNADPKVDAIVFTLCDQPFVSALDILRLVEAQRTSGLPMAAAAYADSVGVPALFTRKLFPDLLAVGAAVGAKRLLTRHADAVATVPLPTAAIDLDTPEDYERWVARTPVPVE